MWCIFWIKIFLKMPLVPQWDFKLPVYEIEAGLNWLRNGDDPSINFNKIPIR
jgi:hypothetical protein